MGALKEAHLTAVEAAAACGCDDEDEETEADLEELGVGGGEATGDAMEAAVSALLVGLGEDDRREGLRRTQIPTAASPRARSLLRAAAAAPPAPAPACVVMGAWSRD